MNKRAFDIRALHKYIQQLSDPDLRVKLKVEYAKTFNEEKAEAMTAMAIRGFELTETFLRHFIAEDSVQHIRGEEMAIMLVTFKYLLAYSIEHSDEGLGLLGFLMGSGSREGLGMLATYCIALYAAEGKRVEFNPLEIVKAGMPNP